MTLLILGIITGVAMASFVVGVCCGILLTDDSRYPDWFDED